jgi:hypothetical protein
VKHLVIGKWSPNTVAELCRNPLIIAVQQYGKRSEGKIRRLGADGPRLLEDDKDVSPNGQPRVILNDPSLRVRKPVGGEQFDPERWHAIQNEIHARGKHQRGIPRAKISRTLSAGLPACGPDTRLWLPSLWPHGTEKGGLHLWPLHADGRRNKLSQKLLERARR